MWQLRHWLIAGRGPLDGTAGGGGGFGSEATTFLARTSGLDATHTNAYGNFIDGLVADGLWAEFDVLYVFATQDETTACLNLISSSYTITPTNSPTFTADQGYAGNGTTSYLKTNFTPSTQGVQHTSADCHWAVRNNTNGLGNGAIMGHNSSAGHWLLGVAGNTMHMRIGLTNGATATNSNTQGFFIANRTNTTTIEAYKAGVSLGAADTSTASYLAGDVYIGATRTSTPDATPTSYINHQVSLVSMGDVLTAQNITDYNARVATYMTAVGAP